MGRRRRSHEGSGPWVYNPGCPCPRCRVTRRTPQQFQLDQNRQDRVAPLLFTGSVRP